MAHMVVGASLIPEAYAMRAYECRNHTESHKAVYMEMLLTHVVCVVPSCKKACNEAQQESGYFLVSRYSSYFTPTPHPYLP